jgi:hypothetical protein
VPQLQRSAVPDTAAPRRAARASRRLIGGAAVALAVGALAGLAAPDLADATPVATLPATSARPSITNPGVALLDSLRGRSRKLRARFVSPRRVASLPILRELFGDSVGLRAAVLSASMPDESSASGPFHFITMRPFTDKVRGRIGAYRIGMFPSEGRPSSGANPEGFLEITASNQDTPVSEHFRLKDFLTHDQAAVWPKYLVLREPLVDKLELVMDELRAMGVAVNRMRVMSGFRTPQYNAQGVGAGGRVQDSRHQYGDAADVYIVNGARDWMSDLDGNGKVDIRDARVLASAAERVERAHPDLVGGIGVYPATSAHGPFVHIDVRGKKARWGSL